MSELHADFIAHLRTRIDDPDLKRRRSARTVEHYRYQLTRHILPTLGSLPVSGVTVHDMRRVLDLMAANRLSPSSSTGVLTALSSMMRYGVKAGALERNIVRDLDRDDRPGATRLTEPRYLSLAEVRMLLEGVGETFRPVAATCAFAGLRASEALGLRWGDLDFKASTITISGQLGTGGKRAQAKTLASVATVPLVPALAAELHNTGKGPLGSASLASTVTPTCS